LTKIKIEYEESDAFHVFSVSDNGVGMKAEDAERVFGFFQRNSTSKGIEGTGLGLSIVREIAEHHQGKAWIEPGTGRGLKCFVSISKGL
jgi:signal transduction histidine kinase